MKLIPAVTTWVANARKKLTYQYSENVGSKGKISIEIKET